MTNSKELKEIQKATAPLREELSSEAVAKMSQRLQATWAIRPQQKYKDRKLREQEKEFLDSYAPLAQVIVEVLFEDAKIAERFFDKKDPRTWEDKLLEASARCFIKMDKGEELDKNGVRTIVEQALSEEPPAEVKELMERLKEVPYREE